MNPLELDQFGFLTEPVSVTLEGMTVVPAIDFASVVASCVSKADRDAFVGSSGSMFKLPATHVIRCEDQVPDLKRWRLGEGGILVHGLGFLFGARVQFHDWWFDGRVPIRSTAICSMRPSDPSSVIARMLHRWKAMPDQAKRRYLSVLYFEGRVQSYYWHWEQFLFRYISFDALYRTCVQLKLVREARSHGERFRALADADILTMSPGDEERTRSFIKLRNSLVHESLVSGSTASRDCNDVVDAAYHLKRINERLILRIAAVKCSFVRAPWSHVGFFSLGLES